MVLRKRCPTRDEVGLTQYYTELQNTESSVIIRNGQAYCTHEGHKIQYIAAMPSAGVLLY